MSTLPPRYRHQLANNVTLVVATLLVLAALGGYLALSAHASPEAETETEVVANWATDADIRHGATVRRSAGVFEAGERLENRPLYFAAPAPELDGSYVLTHDGTDDEPATATVEIELVARSVEAVGNQDVVHWEDRRELIAEEAAIEAGADHEVPFSVNVTAAADRIDRIQEEHGSAPGTTEIHVVFETTVEGTLDGDPVTDTRRERLEIEPGNGIYRVETSVAGEQRHERTESVETTPTPVSAYGPILLVVASLAGIAGLYRARRAGVLELTPVERERLRYERHRSDFEEWISAGSVPADDRDVVRMASLADLVDVAIDANRRVIEASDHKRYVVIVDDVRYVFEPPSVTDDTAHGNS